MFGMNAAAAAAQRMLGIRNDPYMGFGFLVEVEGLLVGGFTEVSGLQFEAVVETYREGGVNDYEHKLAGGIRYPSNLVLKQGVTDLQGLWGWCEEVAKGTITRRNLSIMLLDEQSLPAQWWNVTDAYPVKWSGPEFKAESNAVAVHSVELAHRGISKPASSNVMSALRLAAGAAGDLLG